MRCLDPGKAMAAAAAVVGLLTGLPPAQAQNLLIQDDFTGATSQQNWLVFDGACLTAGSGAGAIPACYGNSYYGWNTLHGGVSGLLPDPVGSGALRFTNDTYNETGAIVSNFTFPSGNGIAVTFSTVTYGGTGADGIGFFLMDGAVKPTAVGAIGGSLGYSCSNRNNTWNGLIGAYIGLGIDEFGNFLNQGDNTSTGNGFVPGRIGLRGAGNTAWPWLNAKYPTWYPSSLSQDDQKQAVYKTCSTAYLYDFSGGINNAVAKAAIPYNYNMIPGGYVNMPASTPLYTNATTRPAAVPITYQLKITQDSLLSLSYSYNGGVYQPVLTNQSISNSNGPMPSTFRFGFSGSTGGSTNIHEVTCFQAAPAQQSSSSAGGNAQQSGQVKTGTQVYLAYYHTNNWWGQVTSQNLLYDSSTDSVNIASVANWDASCVLTGGACSATGGTNSVQGPSARQILTWGGSSGGIPFQWDSLSGTQQTALSSGDASASANRLNYLRGDRSNELTSSGTGLYRQRTSVLADIQDSAPTWVGPPSAPYLDTWSDRINASGSVPEVATGAQVYSAFKTAAGTRLNVVYVGANDGLLHGFRSGAFDGSGNFASNSLTPNDGQEVLAYMPSAVLNTIHSSNGSLDYSSPQYAQQFSVNGTAYAGDLFYNKAWHTWLVGGLGAGGQGFYALDVTAPAQFSESRAGSLVVGDWNSSSITCSNVSSCGAYLGYTYGTPQIRRFHNGQWGFVLGNGFNSSKGTAGIFVVLINPTDSSKAVYYFDTGSGSSTSPNGIAYTTPADLDGDHIVDYVYAGDVKGNVWRFDLTNSSPSSWAVSKYGRTTATPLFATPNAQPISTKSVVAIVPALSGNPRVIVSFGTGNKTPQSVNAAASYASGTQSLYGIWDWDMGNWNKLANANGQKAALTGPVTIGTSNLQAQSISLISGTSYRTLTTTQLCWQGSSDCSTGNTRYGWSLDLPASNEQVIYSPILYQGALVVNTMIPANNTPLNCANNLDSGWTMAISIGTGGGFAQSFFTDSTGKFVKYDTATISGLQLAAVGSPSIVTAGPSGGIRNPYLINQTSSGTGAIRKINPPRGTNGSRITWQQIR